MSRTVRNILIVVILGGAVIGTVALQSRDNNRRPPPPPALATLVRVLETHPRDVRLDVRSSGQVVPRTETSLVAEVGGRIVEVAPSLAAGGYFDQGDVLARIDPRDFRIAVTQAKSRVAQAEVRFALEEGEAEIAARDWENLGSGGEADPLVLREPQLQQAKAELESARAALEKAELDLGRTSVRAPYDGRVRAKTVDLGQFVAPGTPVASIYADDAAEIRLSVPSDEIVYLDLPLTARTGDTGPEVALRAAFGGEWVEWTARVVRVEGEIDPRTRTFHVVARFDDPLRRREGAEGPPLPIGLYVEAAIGGRLEQGVFVLPRDALKRGDQVLLVEDEKIVRRDVEVIRVSRDEAVVRGLNDGDVVCLSNLDVAVDGMQVRYELPDPETTRSPDPPSAEVAP